MERIIINRIMTWSFYREILRRTFDKPFSWSKRQEKGMRSRGIKTLWTWSVNIIDQCRITCHWKLLVVDRGITWQWKNIVFFTNFHYSRYLLFFEYFYFKVFEENFEFAEFTRLCWKLLLYNTIIEAMKSLFKMWKNKIISYREKQRLWSSPGFEDKSSRRGSEMPTTVQDYSQANVFDHASLPKEPLEKLIIWYIL